MEVQAKQWDKRFYGTWRTGGSVTEGTAMRANGVRTCGVSFGGAPQKQVHS